MSLQNWEENEWLAEHQTSKQEVRDLLAVVDRDLQDAAVDRLSPDWRLGISYNAALSNYDRAGTSSHREAEEVIALAQSLKTRVLDWLAKEHPELLEQAS